jgi:hypothetical protein
MRQKTFFLVVGLIFLLVAVMHALPCSSATAFELSLP